ncbi:MAG: S8 family serine peptidase [Blastocatellia bacterium]|nr:S8 family serine peptidase [Blastocatellia bacterium]
MNARYRYVILFLLILGIFGFFFSFRSASAQKGGVVQQPGGGVLSPQALQQIAALLAEKQALTPAQRKIDSALRYGIKKQRGETMTASGEVNTLRSADAVIRKADAGGRMQVDIRGKIDNSFLTMIQNYGGEVTHASEKGGFVRAWISGSALESLAENDQVKNIRPAAQAITHAQLGRARITDLLPAPFPLEIKRRLQGSLRPDLNGRGADLRERIKDALANRGTMKSNHEAPQYPPAQANTGSVVSEGDTAMGALAARNYFGVNGAGVKVGVLSTGVANLAESIASGDLPPDVTVLPGQEGIDDGEGTAMMEIIHDLAPGAKLYFATAFNSEQSFADNIRALRAAGCDIIVDDVIYFDESPFHDDLVSTAVEEVVADGALYFSSAGNEGNFDDGTGSAWEGDFKDSGVTFTFLPDGSLHDFGAGVISNLVLNSGTEGALGLFWSDPLGASDNDYDIFVLNTALTTVVEASTTVQDGDDDPIELINGALAGERIIIYKAGSAKKRALHLDNFGGILGLATSGSTHGHNSVAGAFGVAAIDAALANGGTFSGGPTNQMEIFSSDGYRRVFYRSNGSPITRGNLLFSSNGGELRKKPDLTGADGVSTSVPGFAPFYGTSAAAPHVAAVAALLKSAEPKATQTRIRSVLAKTALDIEALGYDRDSGAGIADAFTALLEIGASPCADQPGERVKRHHRK